MRKVFVTEFLTIDGAMEDPGGVEGFEHGGWSFKFFSDAVGKYKLDETMASDALLLGRKTYEGFAAAWPGRTDDAGFADKFNSMPKYVASTTLKDPLEWNNSHLLGADVPAAVRELKQREGGDIAIHGSRTLIHSLMEQDLIDEFRLMIHPMVLGTGMTLFGSAPPKQLDLVGTRVFDTGTVIATYAPAEAAR
jgi:dihydrofolate reductase